MKKIVTLVGFVCLVSVAVAQKFTVQGKVLDSLRAPLPSATVMLLQISDSSLVAFSSSDPQGQFVMKNVPRGHYILKATFVGFANSVREIKPAEFSSPVFDVGTLAMQPVSSELDALIVQGEKTPVTVKRDTIEFNAGSFKTKPNANVEDLLKKMPGMEVQTDGTIRAQGEQVQRVTVDGREFFGRDPKLATRNLPADAVEKVQVFNRRSDQAQFTGIDDGQREKTINLELKEDRKNGLFGTMMAGAGTSDRFQGRASINRFAKKQQLSFLGMGNNVNEQGFSLDDYMNFTGGSQQMMGGGGSLRLQFDGNNQNGVPLNFGGRQNGIMTNYAGGLNFNTDYGKGSKGSGSYFFNNLNQDVSRQLSRVNYLPGNQSYLFTQNSRQINDSDNHRINLLMDQRLDSNNSLRINVSATQTSFKQRITSQGTTYNVDQSLKNESARTSVSDGKSTNLNASVLYRHRFSKKGRNLSLNLTAGISDQTSDGYLQSVNQFYDIITEKKEFTQTNTQRTDNQTYGAQFSYTEPLGNRMYLEFNYGIRTNRNYVNREVYDVTTGTPVFSDSLSNRYKSDYLYNRPALNFRLNRQKFNVTAGVGYQFTDLKGDLLLRDTTIRRKFDNFLPTAHFNYDFSSFKHLTLDYETSMQEPGIQQLQPVVNNSDPLNITSGNPELRPGYSHSLRLGYTQFDPGKMVGFFTFFTANYITNAISTAQTIDANLVRYSMPVNVRDNLQLNGNLNFNFPMPLIKGRFSVGPSVGYQRGISLVNGSENEARQTTLGGQVRYDYSFKEILTFGLSTNLNQQVSTYSIFTTQNQQYLNETHSAEFNVNFLKHYAVAGSFDYYKYRSQTTGFSQEIPIVNFSVSRFILKNNAGELRIGVLNALDKSLSVSQTATANYLQQEVTNNLGRYYMVSFTYALNKHLNPMGAGGRGGMRVMIRN